MTKSHLKLAADMPSTERAGLADAINRAGPIRAAADKARAAAEKASAALAAAIGAVPAAERAADAARARAVDDPLLTVPSCARCAKPSPTPPTTSPSRRSRGAGRGRLDRGRAQREVRRRARRSRRRRRDRRRLPGGARRRPACRPRGCRARPSRRKPIAASANPSNGERHRREGEAAVLNARIRPSADRTCATSRPHGRPHRRRGALPGPRSSQIQQRRLPAL